MSPDGVHGKEMPKLPDDQWPADDPVLAAFAEDLRIVASGPAPEPRPGLVAAMRQGAVPTEPPAAGRNKKMLVKTLLGGLVAKVAMGVGVATASVAAAGAAGVLPDPAQHAVATVVAATTPFNVPDKSDVTTLATEDEPGGVTTTTISSTATTLAGTDDGGDGDTTRAVNHGACVSTAAKDKSGEGNHGKTVSSVARSDCGKTDGSSSTTTTVPESTTTTIGSTTTTLDDGLRSSNSGPGNSGNGGRGNSGSGGGNRGNSGPGNSGRN